MGRLDNQVKIRGFRIELGEIEAALNQHPDVREAVVVVRKGAPGGKRLSAYIVCAETENREDSLEKYTDTEETDGARRLKTKSQSDENRSSSGEFQPAFANYKQESNQRKQVSGNNKFACNGLRPSSGNSMYSSEEDWQSFMRFRETLGRSLRSALREKLPDYMIPSDFIPIHALPFTHNGKVDRRTLAERPIKALQRPEKDLTIPRTAKEESLAMIWGEVLGIERVGIHDDFFELGGHSLLAVSLMARIEQQFGKQLPLSVLFQGATVAELAARIDTIIDAIGDGSDPWRPLVLIRKGDSRLPFFCLPGAGGNILYLHELARHLGENQPFYGLQAVGLDGEREPDTRIEEMAARYIREIQTVQAHGPYLLGGHSFGSWVALEMAKQLQEQGEGVVRLAVFDTTVPFGQPVGMDWSEADWIIDIAHIAGRLLGIELNISDDELRQLDTEGQLGHLHGLLGQNGWDLSMSQLQALVRIFKANCQMDYVPKDIPPIPISLFKARESASVTRSGAQMAAFSQQIKQDPTWGWGQYAAGPVDVHEVPGDHYTMMSLPNVEVLAERLRYYIANL